MFDLNKAEHIYIAVGYTNLHLGIDGLCSLVANKFHKDPQTNSLFLFCGRKKDRIKALYWDNDGFILLYKRLSEGRYQWPRTENELKELTPQQFRWLMEGLDICQKTAIQPIAKHYRY